MANSDTKALLCLCQAAQFQVEECTETINFLILFSQLTEGDLFCIELWQSIILFQFLNKDGIVIQVCILLRTSFYVDLMFFMCH